MEDHRGRRGESHLPSTSFSTKKKYLISRRMCGPDHIFSRQGRAFHGLQNVPGMHQVENVATTSSLWCKARQGKELGNSCVFGNAISNLPRVRLSPSVGRHLGC